LRSQNRAGKKHIDGFFVVMPARHCLSFVSPLVRRAADEEFVTRARDKLAELERQLREIEDEGKTGKL